MSRSCIELLEYHENTLHTAMWLRIGGGQYFAEVHTLHPFAPQRRSHWWTGTCLTGAHNQLHDLVILYGPSRHAERSPWFEVRLCWSSKICDHHDLLKIQAGATRIVECLKSLATKVVIVGTKLSLNQP